MSICNDGALSKPDPGSISGLFHCRRWESAAGGTGKPAIPTNTWPKNQTVPPILRGTTACILKSRTVTTGLFNARFMHFVTNPADELGDSFVDHLWKEVASAFRRHIEEAPERVDKIASAMVLFRSGRREAHL